MLRAATGLLLAATLLSPVSAHAETVQGSCADGVCRVMLTPDQLLAKASDLVAQRAFDEARPMVVALGNIPALASETHFLAGYIAVETGQTDLAIKEFRAALAGKPGQTRIRLELARALMLKGKGAAADYNFRLAQQDGALPPEIQATIRASRGLLRDQREWHLSTDFGFAPDSNITNGTSAQTVDLIYGNQTIPLTLDENARARSGIGQTANLSAGWRYRMGESIALLADVDGQGTNYKGVAADDYTGQLSIGPELRLSDETMVSVQGLASQRWFGGRRASTQFGTRIAFQHNLDDGQRIGVTLDARHSASGFSSDFTGWNTGIYATYERVVLRSMVASASLFARADMLNAAAYSNRELGFSLGIGGELAHGVNAGISGGVSRAVFQAPLLAFSNDPRRDWRMNARIYVGLRSLRVMGFSPSVTYSFVRNAASLDLYESQRSRFAFSLARYF